MTSPEFKTCISCGADRLESTLNRYGQCPFCVEDGAEPPAPPEGPKYSEIIVKPEGTDAFAAARAAKAAARAERTVIAPRAIRPEDQADVDEAFTIPYTPPNFDEKQAVADPRKELAQRELCRRRFLSFVRRYRPKYMAGWVHEDICRRLERFVEQVEQGLSPRLLLMMPPRSGKSELGSRHLPPWVLGKHPDWEIIAASHTSSLTLSFSRYIRDLIRDPSYQALFPDMRLDPTSQAVENWNTLSGGGYLAAGVGTGITGRGAHILLLDDLVKDIEAADSPTIRENTWEWYGSTAYTRLAPGGGVLGIMCMTGETPVMMADGSVRRLDTLKPSDEIATYACGFLATSRVAAVRSSGRDSVFKITMKSGRIVRANQRHPFLTVAPTGEVSWTRLKNLTTALKIVVVKGSGGNGAASSVLPRGVKNLPSAVASAITTTESRSGLMGTVVQAPQTLNVGETHDSSTATESLPQSTTPCTSGRVGAAPSAGTMPPQGTAPVTGKTSSPSTTATTPEKSEDCSATTATQELGILVMSRWHYPPQGISDFTLDEIVSIEADGEEEVFDVQVDTTENFIANGLVSHNTWWNEDDWAGKIQQVMASGDGDEFEVIKYPAINDEGDEYILWKQPGEPVVQIPPNSPIPDGAQMTRPHNTAIHPARYSTQAMLRIKNNLVASGQRRVWNALYQQNPTPDDGVYFTKEMVKYFVHPPQRRNMFVYQAWDYAITEEAANDYTVCCTIGQDEHDNLYVLHVMRFKSDDGNAIVEHMIDQSVAWKADMLGFEDGQIWKTMKAQYEKRCLERQHYTTYEVLQPLTDKLVRANPLKGRMQLGKVFIQKDQPWTEAFVRELMVFPAGKHDDQVDACFIAGTPVRMADGSTVPIELAVVGDRVATPYGPRRVTHAWKTSEAAEVYEVEFSDGRILVVTGAHPVSTARGWVSVDTLTYSDIIHDIASQGQGESSCREFIEKLPRASTGSSSTGCFTDAIRSLHENTFSGIMYAPAGVGFYTAIYGNTIAAPYRLATRFITRMATILTTPSRIWSALVARPTKQRTLKNGEFSGALTNSRHTSPALVQSLQRGTAVQRVSNGTGSTARMPGRGDGATLSYVGSAPAPSSLCYQLLGTAASPVRTRLGEPRTLSMTRRSALAQKHAVYNLSVEEVECYYANDVLVHNCAWAVRLTLTRSAPRPAPPPKVKSWKDRLKALADGAAESTHMAA